ncbi:hypothetical protein RRG08_022221 [Elysia crispata]|uniref:PKD domain-containing protein n=1 Tax=Elysia crispata TaxID=231223 RepID=A0AAE0YM21_9GAST|nr:hypothetical protein RRG08_022221 [Elysia crispata]
MPSVSGDGDLFGFHVRRRKHLLLNKLCLQISLLSLWSTGKFCFCGNTLPSPGPVAENLCDVHCIGEPTQRCGGVKHVSVHTASKRVAGLAIASDASGTPISVDTPVIIDVSIASGMDVTYQFDYDDGAGRTSNNVTNMLSRTYSVPGEYNIHVFANDVNQTFQDSVAATAVKVEAPPGEAEVECDHVFATYVDGNKCTLTVWSGTSLDVSVTVQSFSYNFEVPDPPLSLAGLGVPSKEALAGDATPQTYLLLGAEFTVSGRILGWEMNIETLGSGALTMAILKPACGTYCYGSNKCGVTCHSTSGQSTTCLASEKFCGQSAMCDASCTPSSRYDDSAQLTWEVVSTHTITASSLGYQYVSESSIIEVEPGYILGLQTQSGQAVVGRVTVGSDQPDVFHSTDLAAGNTIDASTASTMTERHAIRAIASGGTKVHLPFLFTQAGNFSLTATASSTTLPSSPASTATTYVLVEEGVNLAIITSPVYVITSQPVAFEVEPHTGNNVLYNWTLSDGAEFLQSTDRILSHTFSSRGQYQVNVTVYNSVSFKENTTDVIVEDEILGLSASTVVQAQGTPSEITLVLSSGSDYTCTWDFGDGGAVQNTDEAELNGLGLKKAHLYLSAGTYTVTVTCANNVSSQSTTTLAQVQQSITNLRMTSEGANKGDDFYIRWEVDAGTDITFQLTFDGDIITTHTEYQTNKWQSDLQPGRPVSDIPLTLTATNLISSDSLSVNFKILTAIVNPTFTSTTVNASSGESIAFIADMEAGSDLTVTVAFGDGNSNSYTIPPNTDWPGAYTFGHTFYNGGIFQVTATFANSEGSYIRIHTVSVLVGVQSITCELPEFALYYPPAQADLKFIGEVLPTEPKLTINWGEKQSQDRQMALALNTSYPHMFGDTGILHVVATISNFMGTKTCNKTINIVEKLDNPHFKNKFPKAAVGLPFEVTFCLHRGPSFAQCNLTFDFGDGNPATQIQRAGEGQDGCDSLEVVYTDKVTKTVSVTAQTLMETVSKSEAVSIIDGFQDSDITVTGPGDVTFGSSSIFVITYVGGSIPESNSVSIIIDYGDGSTADSGPHNFNISSTGASKQIQHVYTSDNTFNAQVTVFSDCCSVINNVTAGVYKAITGLQANLFFLADIPLNQVKNGLEDNSIFYPTNKALNFVMSNANNAFATAYDVTVNFGGSTILTCKKTSPTFSLYLNDTGSHTIDVVASNAISSDSITSKTINMYELIEGFQVTDANHKVRVYEPKLLNIGFTRVGTDTCVYVDYGDGSKSIYSDNTLKCTESAYSTVSQSNKHALTGVNQLSHSYGKERLYDVTVMAKNAHSSSTVVVSFSISNVDCEKPSVSISDGSSSFAEPIKYKMSSFIRIRGISIISCADNYQNTKSWRIEQIDPLLGTVTGAVSLHSIDISKAELNLDPRFLALGLYKIYYKMTMDKSYGDVKFEAEAFTYILVEESDLIGVMMRGGVSEVERGAGQYLTLTPLSFSTDPDVHPSAAQGISVKSWLCHVAGNDNTNCTNLGFTSSVTSSKSLYVTGSSIGTTYMISATLSKGDREVVTTVFLSGVTGVPPFAYIMPDEGSVFYQLSDGFKVLQSSRLALNCMCENCAAGVSQSYLWKVYSDDYRWPDGWRELSEDDMHDRVLGIDGNFKKHLVYHLLFTKIKS